ncbi:MAG: ribosome biogenesis GTPase Der, partial [Candidatus Puniceispirillaceae bacterium]
AHGEGLVDLHDAIVEAALAVGIDMLAEDLDDGLSDDEFSDEPPLDEEGNPVEVWQDPQADQPMRIAVVGRPNMGKSTLINRLLGEDRLLTGPEAGITRDSIELPFTWKGRPYRLVDTAGMRRRARISDKVEQLMVDDALRAIQFAHLCLLLVDATEELHKQDLAIARLIAEEGRGLVIGANKWDVVRDRQAATTRIDDRLETSLAQLRGVPVIHMSGLHGRGFDRMMSAADAMYGLWNTRIATGRLNRWLEGMLEAHPPPLVDGRRLRIRYMTQIKTRPPTFALFVSRPTSLPESYLRYLITGLRTDFGLWGIPIRMVMRKGENPYAGKARRR